MAKPLNLIFDLDGTLVDSVPSIHASVNKVFQRNGLPVFSRATVQSFVGHGASVLVDRLLDSCGRGQDGLSGPILDQLLRDYEENHALTVAYPGIMDALLDLHATGHNLGLCTNKPLRPALAVLRHFGLTGLFKTVIAGDSLPQRKPDPAPLLAAIAALGARRTLFIGDSEVDSDTAKAALVPFALFTGGYHKGEIDAMGAQVTFDDHAALPGLIRHFAGSVTKG